MLVVLFDRAEPRSATRIKTMAGDRDGAESAGRIYLEYRSAGLTSATVTRIRRALNRLA